MLKIISHQGNAQIKTTVRHHFTPTRMAGMKRAEKIQRWRGGGKLEPQTGWQGCKIVPRLGKVWQLLKTLITELSYYSAVLLLGACPREPKTGPQKPAHVCSQWPNGGHNTNALQQTDVSLHTWEHHSAVKRGEALTLATTCVDLENTMLSERSQTRKDPECVIPLMGNVQDRQIHRDSEWVPGCQGLGG